MENEKLELDLSKKSEPTPKVNNAELVEMVKAYIPEDQKDPKAYLKLVSEQILGVDKNKNARPVNDLIYFLYVCNRTQLDPLARQIYAVYRWDSRLGREKMIIQTSIDGLRLQGQRSNCYGGQDDVIFDKEDDKNPNRASVTVYRLNPTTGERMPVTATARWNEYKQVGKDGALQGMWATMPYNQLGKCAEALALRKAFPQELSGLYAEEELQQADSVKETFKNLEAPKRIKDKREARAKAKEEVKTPTAPIEKEPAPLVEYPPVQPKDPEFLKEMEKEEAEKKQIEDKPQSENKLEKLGNDLLDKRKKLINNLH